jgi:hypothetical protein
LSTIRNPDRYLVTVVDSYRDDCDQGFSDDWAAKQALWKAAVVVYETADDPEAWLDVLAAVATGVAGLKAGQVESTIKSARHKAAR